MILSDSSGGFTHSFDKYFTVHLLWAGHYSRQWGDMVTQTVCLLWPSVGTVLWRNPRQWDGRANLDGWPGKVILELQAQLGNSLEENQGAHDSSPPPTHTHYSWTHLSICPSSSFRRDWGTRRHLDWVFVHREWNWFHLFFGGNQS